MSCNFRWPALDAALCPGLRDGQLMYSDRKKKVVVAPGRLRVYCQCRCNTEPFRCTFQWEARVACKSGIADMAIHSLPLEVFATSLHVLETGGDRTIGAMALVPHSVPVYFSLPLQLESRHLSLILSARASRAVAMDNPEAPPPRADSILTKSCFSFMDLPTELRVKADPSRLRRVLCVD